MSALTLLILGIVLFFIAYVTYGSHLSKKWGIDPGRKTPAYSLRDDKDYVPTDAKVVLGHHFSSIAGAGPITGPIIALMFGWLPVYLWIVVGCIFFGGVHDYGSLVASLRNEGKTIGEVIRTNIGQKAKVIFSLYAFLTICLVVAAFLDIAAGTFAVDIADAELARTAASSGTASVLFVFVALLFGFLVYRKNVSLVPSTIIGVVLLVLVIAVSQISPFIALPKTSWQFILTFYIIVASLMPVWLLLQPRDYLSSFLLYAMVACAVVSLFFARPTVVAPAFVGFTVNGNFLFPILFITVACGAISGFHSLVSSGTTSKQLRNEKDAKIVGYGAMLIEGVVAIVALISVAAFVGGEGTPAVRFASGVATFMTALGIPLGVGKIFVTLTFASFVLTTLDSATRIGRYLLQELGEFVGADGRVKKTIFTNPYVATFGTVIVSYGFTMYGYARIWGIFGSANQLLAGLALLAVGAWVKNHRKVSTWETTIPLVFMFAVTLTALTMLAFNNFKTGNYLLAIISLVLMILAVLEIVVSFFSMKNHPIDMKDTEKL